MQCFTVTVGEGVTRGIRLEIAKSGEASRSGINIGTHGLFLPVAQDWFDSMVDLDQKALAFPGLVVQPLTITHAAFHEEGIGVTDPSGKVEDLPRCSLVSRPDNELDRRALVYLTHAARDRVSYTGCYMSERLAKKQGSDHIKVVRDYPPLEEVIGIEFIAGAGGDAMFIMHPGSAFRVELPRGNNPSFVMYRLTSTGARPNLIMLEPRGRSQAA